ncbi:MAG: hypothetical protein MJ187_00540 [Alphaproteobacteria bacterium]|nr:hypothetical protein [Alphaproteobacteria bacterium]
MTPSRESGGRTGGYAGISIVLTGFRYKNSDKYDKWSEKMREYFYNIITHDKNIFKTTQPL